MRADNTLQPYLSIALAAAQKAGQLLVDFFKGVGALSVDSKSSHVDLVSAADKSSEDLLRSELLGRVPESGFLGEESEPTRTAGTQLMWVVDPLDGTSNFLSGLPVWSVSIALCDAKLEPLVGVVHAPMMGGTWHATKGGGAQGSGRPIHVRPEPPGGGLRNAMIATGFPYDLGKGLDTNIANFCRMQTNFHKIRRLGSAAIDLAYVADGTFDGMWELKLQAWDTAAGISAGEGSGWHLQPF